jgi:RimJ/RimL family protein N-acetyltransferase
MISYMEFGNYHLREWQRDDAASLARHANNVNIWLNLRDAFPHPYTLKDAETYIGNVVSQTPVTNFAITEKSEVIGSIGLGIGKDIHRFTAEMGYWLAEPYWGKGIMTNIVKWMAEYAFNDLKLRRVYAEPFASNTASIKVLKKAGFIKEGIMRSSVFKNGKEHDQVLLSKLSI